MSFFMTISGAKINLDGLEPIELLPISEAQDYVRRLEPELSTMDGTPLFFVHDGQSGTSHNFITEAVNAVCSGEGIQGTLFQKLMQRLSTTKHIVRIWYAGRAPDSHLHVKNCDSYEQAMQEFQKLSEVTSNVNIRAKLG